MKNYWENVPGWFNFQKLYNNVAHKFPDGSVYLELGVFLGKSLFYLTDILTSQRKFKSKVIGIDKWEIDDYFGEVQMPWGEKASEWKVREGNEVLYLQFLNYYNNFKYKDLIDHIRTDTHNSSTLFEDNSIDYIFIDANHTYEYVLKDLELWWPKVSLNGIISGHDINSKWKLTKPQGDVRAALEDYFGKKDLIVNIDDSQNSWWVSKTI